MAVVVSQALEPRLESDSLSTSKGEDAVGTVVRMLVRSTLGIGLRDAVLHVSPDNPRVLIVDLWSKTTYKKRTGTFVRAMNASGFRIDVRYNPSLEVPVDSKLFSGAVVWRPQNIMESLSRELQTKPIEVRRHAKFQRQGSHVVVDPKIVRDWIAEEMPQEIDIRSIDFPEIGRVTRPSKRTIAVITCTVPKEARDILNKITDEFEHRFGIPVVINPVAPRRSLSESIVIDGLRLAEIKVLKPNHVPALQEILKTALRGRVARHRAKSRNMTDRGWMSIDSRRVVLREDLFFITEKKRGVRVTVAIPDITSSERTLGRRSKVSSEGAFILGVDTNAWVFEFHVYKGTVSRGRDPYRAVVRNTHESEAHDHFLRNFSAYKRLKQEMKCPSDYGLVEMLMQHTQRAVGAYLREHNSSFFVRENSKTSQKLLKKLLRAEGVIHDESSLQSKIGIYELMKRVQKLNLYHLLPLLAAQITGSTIVCRSSDVLCGIKPQRGTRELLNQWILAATIDDWHADLPDFLREIIDYPALMQDAGPALAHYEAERRLARTVSDVVKVLTRADQPQSARVTSVSKQGTHCWLPTLRRHGVIPKVDLPLDARLMVQIEGYDIGQRLYLCRPSSLVL